MHTVEIFCDSISLGSFNFDTISQRDDYSFKVGGGWYVNPTNASEEVCCNRIIVDGEQRLKDCPDIIRREYREMSFLNPFMDDFVYIRDGGEEMRGRSGFNKYVSLFVPNRLRHAGEKTINGLSYDVSFYKFSFNNVHGTLFSVTVDNKKYIIRQRHTWQDVCQMNYPLDENGNMLKQNGQLVTNGVFGTI